MSEKLRDDLRTGGPAKRRSRVVAGVVDQVLSSVSNGMMTLALAAVSSVAVFGTVALAVTALLAVMCVQRGVVGNQLLLMAGPDDELIRANGSRALAWSLITGVVAGLLIAAATAPSLGLIGVIVGVCTPAVVAQDALRYVAFASGRQAVAAIWDGLWFAGTCGLFAAAVSNSVSDVVVIGGWGLLAVVSGLGMAVSLRVRPTRAGLGGWIATDWQHRLRFGADAGLEQVTVFAVLLIASVILASSAAAALRGATVLLSPIAVMSSAVQLIVISETSRAQMTPSRTWRILLASTGVLATGCAVIAVTFLALPESVGADLLGESFAPTREVMPFVAGEYAAMAFLFSLGVFLRAYKRSREVIGLRVVSTTAALVAVVVSASIWGTVTAVAVGLLCATAAAGVVGVAVARPWRPAVVR